MNSDSFCKGYMPEKLITRAKAIEYLKQTGISEKVRISTVNRLPRKLDGKRWKVYESDVKKKADELTERPLRHIRPLSEKRKARLRAEMRGI